MSKPFNCVLFDQSELLSFIEKHYLWNTNTDILSQIRFEHSSDQMIEYSHTAVDSFCKVSPVLSVDMPLWSGFMQKVHQGDHPQP